MAVLQAQNIIKNFSEHRALDDVSIEIPKQSIFGLLGPNGAGKTSLIRIITQIIEADQGQIFINGEKLKPNHIEVIGYLPEERGLYKKMAVGEQLTYLARLKGLSRQEAREQIKYWLSKFDILDWRKKSIQDLSKGMQQKIQFIATVLHRPEIIILDEPFSGFDPINAQLIQDEILNLRDQGSTIIFSTHNMESVEELCDHLALIHQGKKILGGSKKVIKADYRSQRYDLKYRGQLGGTLDRSEDLLIEDEIKSTTIKYTEGSNDLLRYLVSQGDVEIIAFEENIPSIKEIFIEQVNS